MELNVQNARGTSLPHRYFQIFILALGELTFTTISAYNNLKIYEHSSYELVSIFSILIFIIVLNIYTVSSLCINLIFV